MHLSHWYVLVKGVSLFSAFVLFMPLDPTLYSSQCGELSLPG